MTDTLVPPKRRSLLSRYSDVLLAVAVVVIIGSMIVPVPPAVMDYLIATNIGISVAVLLAALYIPDATRLPSFPTILLLTTLFRLALNVSTTRLILLEANAGEIIFAFGNFVVQGNYVVGGVVFVVLVLVQFIVVTKGAERVAEVSARFTLDAMPGKQMSIDAEQRSGALTSDQARQRRQDLERESKLYGAMDGAMKFVKGDAIAGICIAIVNIIGGLVIGVTQMNMSAAESAQTFSLLTIGDGLVSQIPSLLIAVAAGLVVTRVAGAHEDGQPSHVAGDIVEQIFGQWKAIAITCVLLCLLASTSPITGLPWQPFVLLAGALAIGSMGQMTSRVFRGEEAQSSEKVETIGGAAPPLTLALSSDLAGRLWPSDDLRARRAFQSELDRARETATRQMGIPIRAIAVKVSDGNVPAGGYALLVHDTPMEFGTLPGGQALAISDSTSTPPAGAVQMRLPGSLVPVYPVAIQTAVDLRSRGATVLLDHDVIVDHLRRFVRRNSAEFLGIQETRTLLENLEKTHPELVRAVTSDQFLPFRQMVEVLQELLRQQVPIRDLRTTIESLTRWGMYFREPVQMSQLVDSIRRDLRRIICDHLATSAGELTHYTINPAVEQVVLGSMQNNDIGIPTPELESHQYTAIWQAVQGSVKWPLHHRIPPVIAVAFPPARAPLQSVIHRNPALAEVVVIANDELVPDFRRKHLGMISPELE